MSAAVTRRLWVAASIACWLFAFLVALLGVDVLVDAARIVDAGRTAEGLLLLVLRAGALGLVASSMCGGTWCWDHARAEGGQG